MRNISYVDSLSDMERTSRVQPNTRATVGSNTISVDDFLQIMAAELSNQNMGDAGGSKTDYISQLAQISTLQYIGEIVASTDYLSFQQEQQFGLSLVGKEVKLLDVDNKQIIGQVDKVKFKNGFTMIEVDGKDYYVGRVIESGSGLEIDKEDKPPQVEEIEEEEIDVGSIVEDKGQANGSGKPSHIDLNNIPDTRPLTRSEMTEEYFNTKFLEEKEFFDRYFKDLRA